MADTNLDDDARHDLEYALGEIRGVSDVLWDLGNAGESAVAYLAHRLREHHTAAEDAFSRIFQFGKYREGADQ